MEKDPKAYESFMEMAADATMLAEKGPEFLKELMQEAETGATRCSVQMSFRLPWFAPS